MRHVTCFLTKLVTRNRSNFNTAEWNKKASLIRYFPSIQLLSFSCNDNNSENVEEKKKSRKIKINPNFQKDFDQDALNKAFDEIARKELGDDLIDSKTKQYYADEGTFEDDFTLEDLINFKENEGINIHDFVDCDGEDDFDKEDLLENYQMERDNIEDDFMSISMEDRIQMAEQDLNSNKVTTNDEFDDYFASDILRESMGIKQELNPFPNDSSPRNTLDYKILHDPLTCPACGVKFQCDSADNPGFIPLEKFNIQMKIHELENLKKKIKEDASDRWSAEDEVDYLLSGDATEEKQDTPEAHYQQLQNELEELELPTRKVICQRCHNLQNHGTVSSNLRPGYSDSSLLSQEKFLDLLKPIRSEKAVIIVLVDLFDFAGSVLPQLDSIVGSQNPVIIAANKADLLPKSMSKLRVETWVRQELEYLGVKCIEDSKQKKQRGHVRLISCKNGLGLAALMEKAQDLAREQSCNNIYVVGAANAGKSTFMNFFVDRERKMRRSGETKKKKIRAGDTNARKGSITTSPLPGTTLEFIKVDLPNGKKLVDTPGLLIPGTLTQLLTPEELKMVVPRNPIETVTFRVEPNKTVLMGGLARVEVLPDSKPFLLTFFVSNDVKLHVSDTSKVQNLLFKHLGNMLLPPLINVPKNPSEEQIQAATQMRLEQMGELKEHDLEIRGSQGWKEASADIALRGLGWIAVTGPGVAKIRVTVPKDIGVSIRPPLMPFDIWKTTAKYTGAKAIRKGGKSKKYSKIRSRISMR